MEDLINTVLEGIYDVIYSVMELVLDSFVGRLLYYAETGLCKVVEMLNQMFQIFAGITKVSYDGEKDYLVNIFFNNRSITNVYWGMALIGIAMAFGFAIAAVIRKMFDSSGRVQQSLGQTLTALLRTIFLILGMSAIMVIVLNSTNVLMQQINYVFNDPENLDLPETIVYTDEEFAAMGRALKTIGNFSLNPSYSGHYNINICYNEIRQDLYYLQQQKVFRYYYATTDADGNTVNTWQSVLQKIANAHDPRSELMIDVSYDAVTKSVLEAMDIIRNDPGFRPLQSYSRVMPAEGLLPLDRYLFLMGTMHAAKNSSYNTRAELTDPVRGPYYSGEKNIYSITQVSSDFDIGFATDYLVVFLSGIALIFDLVIIILNCIARIFNMLFLYLIAPPIFATRPFDGGTKTKQWLTAFIVQAFSVFGTVIAMRLLLILLPIVTSSRLVLFENSMLNAMAKLVLIYGLFEVSKKATGLFTGILADSAGMQSITAGDMSAAGGRLIGSVTGAAKAVAGKTLGAAGAAASFATKPLQNVAKRGWDATGGSLAKKWSTLGMGLEDIATAKAKERLAEEQAYAKLTGGASARPDNAAAPGGTAGSPASPTSAASRQEGTALSARGKTELPAEKPAESGGTPSAPARKAAPHLPERLRSQASAPGGAKETPDPTRRPRIDGASGRPTNMHDVLGVPRSQTNAVLSPDRSAGGAREAPASMGARPTLRSPTQTPSPRRAPEAPPSGGPGAQNDGRLPQNRSGMGGGPGSAEQPGDTGGAVADSGSTAELPQNLSGMGGGPGSSEQPGDTGGAVADSGSTAELPQNLSGMSGGPGSSEQPGDTGGAVADSEASVELPQNLSGLGGGPGSSEQPGDTGGAVADSEASAELPQNLSGMGGGFAEGGYGGELTAGGNVELGEASSRPTIEPAPTPARYAREAPQPGSRPKLDGEAQTPSAPSAQTGTAPSTARTRQSVPRQAARSNTAPSTAQTGQSVPRQVPRSNTAPSTAQRGQSVPRQAARSNTAPSTAQTGQSVPQQAPRSNTAPSTAQTGQSVPRQGPRSNTAPSTAQAGQSVPRQGARPNTAPSTAQTGQSVPQQAARPNTAPSTARTGQSVPRQAARPNTAPSTAQTGQSVPRQAARPNEAPQTTQTGQSVPRQAARPNTAPSTAQTGQSVPQQAARSNTAPSTAQTGQSVPQQAARPNEAPQTTQTGQSVPQQAPRSNEVPPTAQTRQTVPQQAPRSGEAPTTPQTRQSVPQQATRSNEAPPSTQTRQSVPQQATRPNEAPPSTQTRQSVPRQATRPNEVPPSTQTRQNVPQQALRSGEAPTTPQTRQTVPQQAPRSGTAPSTAQTRQSVPRPGAPHDAPPRDGGLPDKQSGTQ